MTRRRFDSFRSAASPSSFPAPCWLPACGNAPRRRRRGPPRLPRRWPSRPPRSNSRHRSVHPRDRLAHGRGAGRRRRRNRRPRHRDAGRARHARGAGRRARSHLADGDRRAAAGGRGQRRADRGAARPRRRAAVRRRRRCPRCRTRKASLDLAQAEFDRIKSLLEQRVVSQCGVRPAPDAGRSGAAAVSSRRRTAPQQQYQSLQAARARVDARAQGARRHGRPRAVRRARRRAARLRRRLRHERHEGRRRSCASIPLRVELTVPEQFVSPRRGRPAGVVRGGRVSAAGRSTARCGTCRRRCGRISAR